MVPNGSPHRERGAGSGVVMTADGFDAAINPGNSGGALVNLKAELVGINSAILSRNGGSNGIGFAVPTNMVRPIIDQLRGSGRVRRGLMGVGIQDLTPDLAESLNLGNELVGVLVNEVRDDGPAAKADLKTGDVIVAVKNLGLDSRDKVLLRVWSQGTSKFVVLRK